MKKYLLSLGIAGLICIGTPIQAQASAIKVTSNTYNMIAETGDAVPYAAWIITNYSLSCSSAKKAVKITGKTSASTTMAEVGFKDIVVQRSSDNVNWVDEVDVGTIVESSSSIGYLSDYFVLVDGGYYYRVKCKHYAKKKGLFGGSQSVENHSNSVWVD